MSWKSKARLFSNKKYRIKEKSQDLTDRIETKVKKEKKAIKVLFAIIKQT